MPRKPRLLADHGVYHLISRGNNHLEIFGIDGGYQYFMELVRQIKVDFSWKIYHYCLMPNHFHILAEIAKGGQLPNLMRHLLAKYSRLYRDRTGYVGHVWAGRYKNPLINKESYLLECGRYIERNPVRAELVKLPEEYLWSSYRYYAFGEQNPLLDPDPSYGCFGGSPTERENNYRAFVKLPVNSVPASNLVPF